MQRFFFFLGLVLVAVWYLSRPFPAPEEIVYGITFSIPYARDTLGLDWKKVYRAILDDLKVRHVRIPAYWTEHEPKKGEYSFDDLDFMLREAGKRDADVILAIGQKLPHWPECHIPEWVSSETREARHAALLAYIKTVVERYRDNKTIRSWQIENEPFLPFFGECEGYDRRFIDVEISRVRALDSRPIIITDSGELSIWAQAYSRADIFGTTMYRTIWNKYIGKFTYPLRPGYFRAKQRLMELLYGKKPVIVVELQAEPWTHVSLTEVPLEIQKGAMNAHTLRAHLDYEKAAGFQEVYLWGVEWWYWMKEKQKEPELWDEAKKVFEQEKK